MSGIRLSSPAGDWTGHSFEQRLTSCAHTLYVHGEISRDEWRRITRSIHQRAIHQRSTIRRAPRTWWRRILDWWAL